MLWLVPPISIGRFLSVPKRMASARETCLCCGRLGHMRNMRSASAPTLMAHVQQTSDKAILLAFHSDD